MLFSIHKEKMLCQSNKPKVIHFHGRKHIPYSLKGIKHNTMKAKHKEPYEKYKNEEFLPGT